MRAVHEKQRRQEIDRRYIQVNPNPRLVWFMNFAIKEVINRLYERDKYAEWIMWAKGWLAGERQPATCVRVAHWCFDGEGHKDAGGHTWGTWHTLGQICWAAKEACYDTPKTGWLVIRYIADAMTAFGIEFPQKFLAAGQQIDGEVPVEITAEIEP